MAKDDQAGARAFVEYYWAVVTYAQQTGDLKLLRNISSPSCAQCDGGADWVQDVYADGGEIRGGDYSVSLGAVSGIGDKDGALAYEVEAEVRNTKQRVLDRAGKVVERHRASTVAYKFLVARVGGTTWRLSRWETLT